MVVVTKGDKLGRNGVEAGSNPFGEVNKSRKAELQRRHDQAKSTQHHVKQYSSSIEIPTRNLYRSRDRSGLLKKSCKYHVGGHRNVFMAGQDGLPLYSFCASAAATYCMHSLSQKSKVLAYTQLPATRNTVRTRVLKLHPAYLR